MQLTSLGFLFVLLPVGSLIYYFLRGAGRASSSCSGYSLLFVGLLSPIVPAVAAGRYGTGLPPWPSISPWLTHGPGPSCWAASSRTSLWQWSALSLPNWISSSSPVGISIAAFTSVGYIIDLYHGECDPIDDPIRYGVFCSFFGKLYIGPIVSAQQFIPQLDDPQMTAEGVPGEMVQSICGASPRSSFWPVPCRSSSSSRGNAAFAGGHHPGHLAACPVLHLLHLLYPFRLSDMARGTGAVFGLDLPENFQPPAAKATRWLISLAGSISPPIALCASMFTRRWARRITVPFPPRSISCSSLC